MKILHTSDWHLGKRLGPFSRLAEQRAVLDEILAISLREEPDLILVAGDLFDNYNPPAEAVELLYASLKRLTRGGLCPVVALAGNHDSPERIEAPDPLARECGIFFAGYPDTVYSPLELESGVRVEFPRPGLMIFRLPGAAWPVRLICTPYANELRLKAFLGRENREENLRGLLAKSWEEIAGEFCDDAGVNLFAGHFFMIDGGPQKESAEKNVQKESRKTGQAKKAHPGQGELFPDDPGDDEAGEACLREPEGERPILCPGGLELLYASGLPRQIQYAALGHLHQRQDLSRGAGRVVYSGSPLAYSLSEAGQEKSVTLVHAEPGKPAETRIIPLQSGRRIYRMAFETSQDCLDWLAGHQDSYVELSLKTGDYISPETKAAIFDAHDGILSLIPITDAAGPEERPLADPQKTEEELFVEYFKTQNGGIDPGRELMEIFKEVLSRREGE